jgi:hypothetical protein
MNPIDLFAQLEDQQRFLSQWGRIELPRPVPAPRPQTAWQRIGRFVRGLLGPDEPEYDRKVPTSQARDPQVPAADNPPLDASLWDIVRTQASAINGILEALDAQRNIPPPVGAPVRREYDFTDPLPEHSVTGADGLTVDQWPSGHVLGQPGPTGEDIAGSAYPPGPDESRNVLLVQVRKVGGAAGGYGSTCSFTYDVYDLDGASLGSALSPRQRRIPNVAYDYAADDTYGLAGYDADGELLLLTCFDEQPAPVLQTVVYDVDYSTSTHILSQDYRPAYVLSAGTATEEAEIDEAVPCPTGIDGGGY